MEYVECLKDHYDAVDRTFCDAISLVETPPRIVKHKKAPVLNEPGLSSPEYS